MLPPTSTRSLFITGLSDAVSACDASEPGREQGGAAGTLKMAAGQTSCRRKSCVFKLACQYCPFRKIRKNKNYDIRSPPTSSSGGRWSPFEPPHTVSTLVSVEPTPCMTYSVPQGVQHSDLEPASTPSVFLYSDSEAGGSAMDTGPLPSLQAVPEGVPPSGSDPDPPSRALADRDNQNWVQPEDRAPSLQPDQDRIPEHRESSMEMDMDVDPETGERALG